jgi:hypothetical protein
MKRSTPSRQQQHASSLRQAFLPVSFIVSLEISYLRRTWSGGFITNRRTVMAAVGAPESTTHPASAFPLCNTRNRKHERDIQYHTVLSKLKLL